MGDSRYDGPYQRLLDAPNRSSLIHGLRDDELVQSLAAACREPYVANVEASELLNRLRRKNAILAVAGEGLCVLDGDGRLTFLNPVAERALGFRVDAEDPVSLHEIVHAHGHRSAVASDAHCPLLLALRSNRSIRIEEDAFLGKGATRFPVSYTVSPIQRDGETMGFVLVFRDIAQMKRLFDSLEPREHRLEEALHLAQVDRWDWDILQDTATWSPEGCAMLGFDPDCLDTTFRTFLDLVPEGERASLQRLLQSACERREVFSLEHRIVRPDGSDRILRPRGRFVYGDDGTPVAAWGIHQDISEGPPAANPEVAGGLP